QYYVKINALKDVLTKGIFMITPEKEDSIGNDPIHVNDVWLTNNYLNFEMQYYGGNMIHYINLVKDNNAQGPAGSAIKLQLRHNNKSDSGHIPLKALVSFDLSSLKQVGKTSVDIVITGRDFDGQTFTKTITYKYDDEVVALKKTDQTKLPSLNNLKNSYQRVN
ncbi:MAG: NigD-like C-terminal domain-containing protein, partial [Bacteroidota bacterium]|nr:NigD-like C-terminal domain-containing protein [Bacteroidota bacterium]